MDQKQINDAYNRAAGKYAEQYYNELDYKPLDRQLLDRFCSLTGEKGTVCDMGCGPGEVADYLHKKGLKVEGIDISEEMINEAGKLNKKIDFKVDNMLCLNINDNYYTGICSFYAIVNFRYNDIKNIINEYYRVLKDKGILLLAFHSGRGELLAEDFFETGKPLLFYFLNEDKIINILKDTGFNITDALVRYPYKEEYPSKRTYIFAEKK
jgi:ubiquinone/menaquinone biosynthesis C-methylase UbiE